MRLDHVSYVTSHDQLADTVQRLGALIGSPFIDGGFHPRFGTRNFTCALKNDQYIEVVCPLDHPATDETPFGRAVKLRAEEGGGRARGAAQADAQRDPARDPEGAARPAPRGRPSSRGPVAPWPRVGRSPIGSPPGPWLAPPLNRGWFAPSSRWRSCGEPLGGDGICAACCSCVRPNVEKLLQVFLASSHL